MDVSRSPQLFVGVIGLGVLQVAGMYEQAAPGLKELRAKEPGDMVALQQLLDADILTGAIVFLIAVLAAYETKSLWPIVLLVGGFAMISGWYHLVLASPKVGEI